MKVTAEDLKRQYAEMSDDALLELNGAELSDLARKCYDEEMARRSLKREETPVEEPVPDEEMVTVANFLNLGAGKMAQSALESADVPCFLSNEYASRGIGVGPHGLTVPASYERQAREILDMLPEKNAERVETWLRDALPGVTITIEDMLAEEDLVATRLTIDGSHQGFCFARIEDGKIAETWHNFDQLGLRPRP